MNQPPAAAATRTRATIFHRRDDILPDTTRFAGGFRQGRTEVAEAAVLFARISSRLAHRCTEHAFEEENAETDSNAELAQVAEFFLQEARRASRARRLNGLGRGRQFESSSPRAAPPR